MKGKRQETKTEKRKRQSGGCTGWRLRGFLIVIFAAVYFLSMLLATWLDQLGIRADNSEMLSEVSEAVSENLLDEGVTGRSRAHLRRKAGKRTACVQV